MIIKTTKALIVLAVLFAANSIYAQTKPATKDLRTLIVFFDGLRPDYITPEQMPNLYAFSKKAAYGKQHHSVFPTVTRVNGSSYSTGSYPGTHGLMGNEVYFPEVNKVKGMDTGNYLDLDKITAATNDHLLTAPTMGEILQKNGSKMMVFSSGSTGQALMQNNKISGGAVINVGMIRPESMKSKVLSEIGPVPSGFGIHKWAADALMKYGITMDGPLVSAIWFADPDENAHHYGIGSPQAVESIKAVDAQFGRILKDIDSKGLRNNFNIIISADHGFVTEVGKVRLKDFLIEQGLKKDTTSEDVVVAEGAIYVKDHNPVVIKKIVAALQAQEWVGAIFTKGKKGETKGSVDGTLSFESIHWDHPTRSGDILVDVNWNDNKNAAGYPGTGFQKGLLGSHGGFSPYEVHIALLASGPSFKKSFEGNFPSSNVDIVPTILHIHNLPIPVQMDGRILYELLDEKAPAGFPTSAKTETLETSVKLPSGSYKLQMERSIFGKYVYDNYAKATRN